MAPRKKAATPQESTQAAQSAPQAQPAADPRDQMIAELMATVRSLSAGSATSHKPAPQQLYVGIRNIGGSTVGVPEWNGEKAFSLNAPREGVADPNVVAVIPWPRWMELRRSVLYGWGLIKRDDSILGGSFQAAPEDRPEELHPDHAKNAIERPKQWIEEHSEREIREAIAQMTSEDTLRTLLGAVDDKVRDLRRELRADGQDPTKEKAAEQALPMMYQLVETLVTSRLQQLGPQRDGDGLPAFVRGR